MSMAHSVPTQLATAADLQRRDRRAAALGFLMASAAHELNNLNMIVTGNLELMNFGGQDELIGKCQQSAWRSAAIMRSLTALAEPSADLTLDLVLDEMLVLLQQRLEQHEIVLDRQPGASASTQALDVDGLLLGQVLYIVLSAACASVVGSGKASMTIRCGVQGGQVVCEISDSGCGLPIAQRQAVEAGQEQFASEALQGRNGLRAYDMGTAVQIMREMGGDLQVQSRLDHGSVIQLQVPLPVSAQRQAGTQQELVGEAAPQSLTGRLLVIDDEPIIGELIGVLLDGIGLDIVVAENVEQARQLSQEPVTGILTDLHLRDTKRHDLADFLQPFAEQVPVIVMSGTVAVDLQPSDFGLPGVVACIGKPFTRAELWQTLSTHLDLHAVG